MAVAVEPIYLGDQIVDKDGRITERMRLLWQQVIDGFAGTSAKASLSRSNQTAALVTTSVVTLTAGGRYRLSYYLRKTIADGVSSSAAVTFGWSDTAVALTEAFAALTTDTSAAHQSGSILVNADASTDITVAVAYASNTPGQMAYSITVTVEPVQ
jgi:hypothetical protein